MALQKSHNDYAGANLFGPWKSTEFWRLNHDYTQRLSLRTAEKDAYDVTMHYRENGAIHVTCDDESANVCNLTVQDDTFEAQVKSIAGSP